MISKPSNIEIRTKFLLEQKNVEGRVLEIGCGRNFSPSNFPSASNICGVDKSPNIISALKAEYPDNNLVLSDAIDLPFDDNFFDVVVSSFVLCSVTDNAAVIKEIRRILKKDGLVLCLEHVQSKNRLYKKIQDFLTPIYSRLCNNCHLNRDPLKALYKEGFKIKKYAISSTNWIPWAFIEARVIKENKIKNLEF